MRARGVPATEITKVPATIANPMAGQPARIVSVILIGFEERETALPLYYA